MNYWFKDDMSKAHFRSNFCFIFARSSQFLENWLIRSSIWKPSNLQLLQIVKERLKIHASTSEKVEKYTFHMAKCPNSRKPQYANKLANWANSVKRFESDLMRYGKTLKRHWNECMWWFDKIMFIPSLFLKSRLY